MNNQNLPEHIKKLCDHGEECLQGVLTILNAWPVGEYCRRIDFEIRSPTERKAIWKVIQELESWVEAVALHRALHDQRKIAELMEIVKFALTQEDYKDNAIEDAEKVRDELLSLVKTMTLARRADGELCSCDSQRRPVVRRYQSRSHSHTYRQRNPKFQRKI